MIEQKEHETIFVESKGLQINYLQDLMRFRELFYFFSLRDIIVRYRQAFFGIAWAIVRPVLTMIMFTLIFGRIAHLPSDNIPYGLFVLAGMIPWLLFSNTTVDACHSLLNNAHLITKIYFPRMIIPLSQLIVHLVDFLISLAFFGVLMVFFQQKPTLTFVFFPLFVLLAFVLCAGTSLWLSALTVKFRDFRILVPFIFQFGMFLSPVGYGTFLIPDKLKLLYFLNPIVGIIDGFRWTLFGISHAYMPISIAMSVAITAFLLITGAWYFRLTERSFADQV